MTDVGVLPANNEHPPEIDCSAEDLSDSCALPNRSGGKPFPVSESILSKSFLPQSIWGIPDGSILVIDRRGVPVLGGTFSRTQFLQSIWALTPRQA